MYPRYQSNNSCKLTGDRTDDMDLVVRDLTSLYSLRLRRISNIRTMHRGGVRDITSLTRGSNIWVGEVINHKNLVALLLVPKMLMMLDLPKFKGSP